MGQQVIQVTPVDYAGAVKKYIKEETDAAGLALSNAQKLVIKDTDGLKMAKEDFTILRQRVNDVEAKRKGITGPINDAVKAINALFSVPADMFDKAKRLTEKAVTDYERKVEEERLAEEKRLREIAEREEAKRRAEKERQEREWREKEEAKRREAEEAERKAKAARNEKERKEAEAAAAKAREEAERAAAKADERAIEASEVFVAPKTVEKVEVKVSGTKKVERWYAQIIDASKIPDTFAGRSLWVVDESALNELAKSLKTKDCPIPGVRFYSEQKLS